MKKLMLLTMVLLFALAAVPVQAVDADHPVNFYINFGVMTDDSFNFDPFWWYGGINLDFHLNDYLMISPEANVITSDFKFDYIWLEPAVLLNFKYESFFFGAGTGKMFLLTGDGISGDFFLKLNAGFSGDGGMRIRVFIETPFDHLFASGMMIGAQVGIGI